MRQSRNFKFYLIFAPLGIAQISLALRSLVAKIQISNFRISNCRDAPSASFFLLFCRFKIFL